MKRIPIHTTEKKIKIHFLKSPHDEDTWNSSEIWPLNVSKTAIEATWILISYQQKYRPIICEKNNVFDR